MASSAAGSVADLAAKQAARQAAEAASKAAAKAASKAAAEAAQSATKAASKAAADAAQSAAEAAAKAAKSASDEAASLAAKAAKSGDSASQSAATAAAKRADDLAKKAADARTVADDAAGAADDVAGAGAKGSKGVSKTTVAAGLIAGGAVTAGFYIDKELKDASEDIKDCVKICLPENWDEYIYGENVKKPVLVYRDIEDPGEDQPLCTKKIKDCGDFCKKKCTEIHKADFPGAGIIRGAGDAAGDLFDRLNPFKGFGEILGNVAYGFLIFIIILVVLGAAYMAYKATRRS